MQIFSLMQLAMTFVFAGFSLFVALPSSQLKSALGVDKLVTLVACLGVGPLLISYILSLLMAWLPGLSNFIYVSTVMLMFAVILFVAAYCNSITSLQNLTKQISTAVIRLRLRNRLVQALLLVLSLLIALLVFALLFFPLYSNDPLGYFQAAKLISQNVDFSIYPIIDTELSSGFYGPWTHPPGYVGLLVWANFFNDSLANPGVGRFVTFYFALCSCFLLIAWARSIGLLAAIFLLATPIYFAGISSSHIDAIRMFPVILFFIFFYYFALIHFHKKENKNSTPFKFSKLALFSIPLGIFLGLSIFVHAMAIVCLPVLYALYFLYFWRGGVFRLILPSVCLLIVAGIFLFVFMQNNYDRLGVLISDKPVVWQIEKLMHDEHTEEQRNIATFKQKISNGVLKGLTRIRSFGFVYWVFFFAVIYYLYSWFSSYKKSKNGWHYIENNFIASYCFILVMVYFLMTISSVLIGSDALIKNDRYALIIHAFVATFAAWGCLSFFENSLISQDES